MENEDQKLIQEWLASNEAKKLPTGRAEGADDLRYFAKRGANLRYVVGEKKKKAVSTTGLMKLREERIARRKARREWLATPEGKAAEEARKAKRAARRERKKKRRAEKQADAEIYMEPRLSVFMGERIDENAERPAIVRRYRESETQR